VIVSLQQTVHDGNCALRIFALLDDVMAMLCEELGVEELPAAGLATAPGEIPIAEAAPKGAVAAAGDDDEAAWVWRVPYSALDGGRLPAPPPPLRGEPLAVLPLLTLDLRPGAQLVLARGADAGAPATVLGRNKNGHWRVSVERQFKRGSQRTFTETRLLGAWWPFEAARGEVAYIPLVPRAAYDAAAAAAGMGASGPTAARLS